ncbi:MAG TPA: hypothetical protein V6D48_08510, partial [Oculatellaceae cyanobacterium]
MKLNITRESWAWGMGHGAWGRGKNKLRLCMPIYLQAFQMSEVRGRGTALPCPYNRCDSTCYDSFFRRARKRAAIAPPIKPNKCPSQDIPNCVGKTP